MHEILAILRHYPAAFQPSRIEPLGSAGGMSGAQFWRMTTPEGTLLLRRWPVEHPTPGQLRFVHAVLRHAADRGVGVLPLPIATQHGQSVVQSAGYLWELTPWLSGAADYETSPNAEKLRAAMTTLAAFHNATSDFPVAGGGRIGGRPRAVTRRLLRLRQLANDKERDELSQAVSDELGPEIALLARQFVAALSRAVPRTIVELEPLADIRLPLQPCIRDIWHDHILFTGDEVTGFVDFGALDIDTPATDLARLLGSLADASARPGEVLVQGHPGFDTWRAGLDAYSAIRPLSQHESLAAFALDKAGTILAGCNWLRWLYISRRHFEDRAQVTERFRRITARTNALSR